MYTNKLKEGNGMLFTFDEEADHTMWMKNVNIPLDMIFIDKDKKVVKVQTVQPCKSKPCELYKAGQPIMHVLELNLPVTLVTQFLSKRLKENIILTSQDAD